LSDEYCSDVINVSTGGAGNDQIKRSGEQFIAVVVFQKFLCIDACGRSACQRIGCHIAARIVAGTVDAIRVARDCVDEWMPVKGDCERQCVFAIASAATIATYLNGRFAAREDYARRLDWPSARGDLQGEFSVLNRE
jgi:hypothetical protein